MTNYPKIPFTEIATLIRGVSYDKSVALLAPKDGFLPILRANNIQKDLILNDLVYVPNDFVKEEQMIREGDIVLAMSSGSKDLVGKSAQADKDINAAFGTFCGLIRAKESVDSKFLGLYFQTQEYRNFVSYQSKGVNICNLKKKDVESLQIPLPPLPIQHQIVSRIESLFAELDKAEKHLRTSQQQLKTFKQAVLNHWLNNEEGKWETVKLGEVAEKIQIGPFGTQLHKSDYIHGGIPLINPMHICNKKILPDYSFSVSNDKYKELTNYYLKKDDVILGRRGEMGRCAVVSEKEDGMLCGTGSLFIRGGELLNATYLCHLLSSQKIVSYFENSSSGTTMNNLNQGIIRSCEISFPPLPEQQRIVQEIESRLSLAEAAEVRIAESLQKTEALRQSILKKAFSGELVSTLQ